MSFMIYHKIEFDDKKKQKRNEIKILIGKILEIKIMKLNIWYNKWNIRVYIFLLLYYTLISTISAMTGCPRWLFCALVPNNSKHNNTIK